MKRNCLFFILFLFNFELFLLATKKRKRPTSTFCTEKYKYKMIRKKGIFHFSLLDGRDFEKFAKFYKERHVTHGITLGNLANEWKSIRGVLDNETCSIKVDLDDYLKGVLEKEIIKNDKLLNKLKVELGNSATRDKAIKEIKKQAARQLTFINLIAFRNCLKQEKLKAKRRRVDHSSQGSGATQVSEW